MGACTVQEVQEVADSEYCRPVNCATSLQHLIREHHDLNYREEDALAAQFCACDARL